MHIGSYTQKRDSVKVNALISLNRLHFPFMKFLFGLSVFLYATCIGKVADNSSCK